MENTVFDFIRELLSSGGIPYHYVTLPCQDWDWMDLGLRSRLLGLEGQSLNMNRYFENLEDYTLYHYMDFFQCNYSVFSLPGDNRSMEESYFMKEIGSSEDDCSMEANLHMGEYLSANSGTPVSDSPAAAPVSAEHFPDKADNSAGAGTSVRQFLVIGPVLFEAFHGERYESLFQSLDMPPRLKDPLRSHYQNIPVIGSSSYYENLMCVFARFLFRKKPFRIVFGSEGDLENLRLHYSGISRVPEQPFLNVQYIEKRYDAENLIFNAIGHANEAQAIEGLRKLIDAGIPPRLSNNLRDKKDLTITLNTLMRKAAELAGVHPIHIDSFSNRSIQQIEQLASIEQCRALQRKLALGYCRLVKKYSLKGYSLPIQKAVTYVTTDLSADLSLKALAKRLNVTSSYLSSLFRKEMGMTLTDYVNQQRIAHAQYLLLNTSVPIKAIAQQCGIADLNYFVRMFKRAAGVTPKVYRDTALNSQQLGIILGYQENDRNTSEK